MGKTLLTGGTGFIGSKVALKLLERGDDLKLLVRESSKPAGFNGRDFEKAKGDVLDRRSLRRAMKGVDKVFHVAGCTDLRANPRQLFDVNVTGTKNVLGEAMNAGVERAVHTSSVAAVGSAEPGSTVDEANLFTIGHLGMPYVNSKREGEIEALRLAAQGLPLVVVNPALVLGRGDLSIGSTYLVRMFLKRQIPALIDGGQNVVDVDDVAAGHLLADEKGKIGERYILGGRNYTNERLFAELSRVSSVEPPAVKLPYEVALRFAQVAERLPGSYPLNESIIKSAALYWNYKINKAKRELGYSPRPAEETLTETVEWCFETEGDKIGKKRKQPLPLRALGSTIKLNGRIMREAEMLLGRG